MKAEQKLNISIKNNIEINYGVIKTIVKSCDNLFNHNIEGILFGHEDDESDKLYINNAIPFKYESSEVEIISQYLELNRMDFVKIGFFSCKEFADLLNKRKLKNYIDFQKNNPNAVFIYFDYKLSQGDNYSFYCYRLSQKLMELNELIEIEENEPNIFKKFSTSDDLITKLNFKINFDLFTSLTTISEYSSKREKENIYKSYVEKNNLFSRINVLNKKSDNFIDEQKKYINYYKTKKSYGKKEAEFQEYVNKKGSELSKIDKVDISLLTNEISELTNQIKSLTEGINVKNSLSLNIY